MVDSINKYAIASRHFQEINQINFLKKQGQHRIFKFCEVTGEFHQ
ncbi:hypothetical protein [Nostoc foliaceum]|nr:hypothetical protein [Nostoc foliaceum]